MGAYDFWGFIGLLYGAGAKRAWNTSTSLGITGWERVYYTVTGLYVGDYLVVKDNWDIVSQTIEMDGDNFSFQDNPYYSFWTASLFAKYLKENYYANEESRTTLGLYLELQFHYVLYLIGNEHGTDGAYMGPTSEDSNASFFERIANLLRPRITKVPFLFI